MRIYFTGCVFYLVFSIAFAASPLPSIAGAMLFVVGFGGAFYAAMQTTLVITSVPAEVRGRMMGVLSVCIGTGPLGFYHVGTLADWIGARDAVALIGLEGLVAAIVVSLVWPEIHRRRTGSAPPGRRVRRRLPSGTPRER